jgi:hypothetical protein
VSCAADADNLEMMCGLMSAISNGWKRAEEEFPWTGNFRGTEICKRAEISAELWGMIFLFETK